MWSPTWLGVVSGRVPLNTATNAYSRCHSASLIAAMRGSTGSSNLPRQLTTPGEEGGAGGGGDGRAYLEGEPSGVGVAEEPSGVLEGGDLRGLIFSDGRSA
jgi:hypothetical protein